MFQTVCVSVTSVYLLSIPCIPGRRTFLIINKYISIVAPYHVEQSGLSARNHKTLTSFYIVCLLLISLSDDSLCYSNDRLEVGINIFNVNRYRVEMLANI